MSIHLLHFRLVSSNVHQNIKTRLSGRLVIHLPFAVDMNFSFISKHAKITTLFSISPNFVKQRSKALSQDFDFKT
jgi:hypothetical protein